MPPPIPPVSDATWTEAAPERYPGLGADVGLRHNLLMVNATGLLAGYFAMHNQWVQVVWFALLTAAWFWAGGARDFTEGLRQDRWLAGVAALAGLMLARSSLLDSPGMTTEALGHGWAGTLLLLAALMMLWQAGRMPGVARTVGLPLCLVACAAALGSMLLFYVLHPDAVFGSRLQNWFVYGGWNTVCTGLTFGFAATWALVCWGTAETRREKTLWLLLAVPLTVAVLLTISRGALLAMVAGQAGMVLVAGWRRHWRPLALLLVVTTVFLAAAPYISQVALDQVSHRLGVPAAELTDDMIGDSVVPASPVNRMVSRADNGRGMIVAAAVGSLTTWQDWVFGKGMWCSNDAWSCSLHWYPEHLHSVFTDALVRGGLPALLGLLGLVGWGGWRALLLARRGEVLWLALAGFGVTAVMLDGDSAFNFLSVPRYEMLILWTPLVMASARFTAPRKAEEYSLTEAE